MTTRIGHHRVHGERALPPTPRQLQVLHAIAAHHSRKEAGAALGITEAAVRAHMHRLFARLGVEKLTEALSAVGWLLLPGDDR